MALIDECKKVLGITSNTFNDEISNLIDSGVKDLNRAGVDSAIVTSTTEDALVKRALKTYVGYQFNLTIGDTSRAEFLKKSYDEQKAQMSMATGYTTGGGFDVSTGD